MGLTQGGSDDTGALRKQLKKESTRRDPNGAALRWAFAAGPCGMCELQLQSLPLPESSISSKPLLTMDDVAVVVLKVWPIRMAVWDGMRGLSGPAPILYAEQPEELRSLLSEEPMAFAAELNKFMLR